MINTQCSTAAAGKSGSKACQCVFEWQEINPQSGQNVAIPRLVKTKVSTVQPSLLECSTPPVYNKEISQDTVIKVSVIPAPGSTEKFSTNKYSFSKANLVIGGDFQDAEGRSFANIHRYTCYEQFKKGTSITNKQDKIQEPSGTNTAKVIIGTQFCVAKDGSNQANTACPDQATVENSSQAYYYNMYIRSNDIGGINAENSRYKCPLVKETLPGLTNIGASNYYWPLDSTFSLAINPSGDFVVAVEGYSRLGIEGDPTSASTSCLKGAGGGGDSSGGDSSASSMLKTCLGFAGKPKADGTCPAIKTASGQAVFTYRLRRYIVLYPPLFKASGEMQDGAQPTDTIYVLDRPVLPPNSSFLDPNSSPTSPFTMLGPKPCPFAFFDHKNVTGTNRAAGDSDVDATATKTQYVATNNTAWTGTNIDGTRLPSIDTLPTAATTGACAATLPIFNSNTQTWSALTLMSSGGAPNGVTLSQLNNGVNPSSTIVLPNVYIRPTRAWTPIYVEDTEFLACAPQAQPLRDPPLHFARNTVTGNVGYCAGVYPTQNPNTINLGTAMGTFTSVPFTSPYVKNAAGASCTATETSVASHTTTFTLENTTYTLADAVTDPGKTCDRTVMNISPDWTKFPLQARPGQIESALTSESGYECTVVYDNSGLKSTNLQTPTQGCCGTNVYVWSGTSPAAPNNATTAHFEPNQNLQCLTPTY